MNRCIRECLENPSIDEKQLVRDVTELEESYKLFMKKMEDFNNKYPIKRDHREFGYCFNLLGDLMVGSMIGEM